MVNGFSNREIFWQHAPRAATLENIENGVEHPPQARAGTASSPRSGKQMRKAMPLEVGDTGFVVVLSDFHRSKTAARKMSKRALLSISTFFFLNVIFRQALRMSGFVDTRNMERLTLGDAARWRIARRTGAPASQPCDEDEPPRCKDRVAGWRVDFTDDVEPPKSQPSDPLKAGRGWGTDYFDEVALTPAPPHHSLANEPALQGASSDWKGLRAAADVLARQREQPTGGYGTPKPVARCVPTRAKNEPGRADIVTPSAVERPRHE